MHAYCDGDFRRRDPDSVITPETLAQELSNLSCPLVADGQVHWIEDSRLMVSAVDGGDPRPAMPDGPAVRCELYGYGAFPYAVRGSTLFYVDADDQALYSYDDGCVTQLSPLHTDGAVRYGAPALSPDGRFVYCVRERELGSAATHDLVRIAADGSGELRVVAQGHDFYGAPVPHPDGSALAYTTWDFPNMAWDESRLWSASLTGDGQVGAIRLVAGGAGESVTQPAYSPDGVLHYVSDRTGWWNLHAHRPSGVDECLTPEEAEFGRPDWFCGLRTYGFAGEAGIVAVSCRTGRDHLVRVRDGAVEELMTPLDAIEFVATSPEGRVVVVGSAPHVAPAVARISIETGEAHALRKSWPEAPDRSRLSEPEPLVARGDDGHPVHALFYRPAQAEPSIPPLLIVLCHGGPTVMAGRALDVTVQFWTSRGFAVVAVNYRGSPGYGRAYRQSIRGHWGTFDVEDCLAVVRHLVTAGVVDPARIVARGRSSGGLTALRMAAAADRCGVRIAAVISVSGVTDPADLVTRTHKMESRYLDGLLGPWPEAKAVYESRSIFAELAALTAPTLLLHGARDRVVPVDQAERLRRSLAAQGVRADFVSFEDEGHEIRRPENLRAMARAELDFVAAIVRRSPATAPASVNPQRSE